MKLIYGLYPKSTKGVKDIYEERNTIRKYKDGSTKYKSLCKQCFNVSNRSYQKKYYQQNKKDIIQYQKKYRDSHKDEKREYDKKHFRDHRIEKISKFHAQRARECGAGGSFTVKQWEECLDFFGCCAYSALPIDEHNTNVDHIVPISKGRSSILGTSFLH